jgi:nitroreductase
MDDGNLFEIIDTTRSMRRLKPDPVPDALIERIIAAGTKAPNGQNTQPWAFVVVRDAQAKRSVQQRYQAVMERAMGDDRPDPEDRSRGARTMRAAWHLAEHLHEAPVLLLVYGKRDWPFAVAAEDRKGLAPPSYGSTFPAVQNILLACRALGLGATLTTLHQVFEAELCERFGIPDTHGVVALIPIGYPLGRFGPVRRRPLHEVTHLDHWGNSWPD